MNLFQKLPLLGLFTHLLIGIAHLHDNCNIADTDFMTSFTKLNTKVKVFLILKSCKLPTIIPLLIIHYFENLIPY